MALIRVKAYENQIIKTWSNSISVSSLGSWTQHVIISLIPKCKVGTGTFHIWQNFCIGSLAFGRHMPSPTIQDYYHSCEQPNVFMGLPGGSVVKNLPANAGGKGSIPGSVKSPEGENGNPLQYFCLENPMDTGIWKATAHEVAKSWTPLSN